MADETCGAECADGTPCEHPAGENGRCWIPTHNPDADGENPGRPEKYDEDRAADAIDAAREGFSKAGCARAAGVVPSTLNNWLDRNPAYKDGEFLEAFTRARHRGERTLVTGPLVDDPMDDREIDGQHARFLLSTSFDYKKTEKTELEHSGEVDGFEFVISPGGGTDADDDR